MLMEYRRVSLMMNSGVKIAMKALYVTIENKAMYKNTFQNPISREKQPR
jgi:hypothetical protein